MVTKTKNRYSWLETFIALSFLLSLFAAALWGHETYSSSLTQAKISFTLGIEGGLNENKKQELYKARINLLTSDEVLKAVLALWPLTQQQEDSFIVFIKSHLRPRNHFTAVELSVEHKDAEKAKALANNLVNVYAEQLDEYRKAKAVEISEGLASIDAKIKALLASKEAKKTVDQNSQAAHSSEKLNSAHDWSFVEKRQLIARYVDTYVHLVRLESLMHFLKQKGLENIDYFDFPEQQGYDDLRVLMRSAYILKLKLDEYNHKTAELSAQRREMLSQYNILQKQIQLEIKGLIGQLANQIVLDKSVIDQLAQKIGGHILPEEARDIDKRPFNDPSVAEFLAFRAKLQYYFSEREILEREQLALSEDNAEVSIIEPARIVSLGHFSQYYKYIFFSLLSVWLLSCVFFLMVRFFSFQEGRVNAKEQAETLQFIASLNNNALPPRLIGHKQLLRRLMFEPIKRVAFFGFGAEQEAARLLLQYRESGKRALLIDIAGKELPKYIGKHLGLTDVLSNLSALHAAIYIDTKLGIDVLPKGQINENNLSDAQLHTIVPLLQHLEKHYDVLCLAISEEPFLFLEDLITPNTDLVVCSSSDNHRESYLWTNTLRICGFERIFLLKNLE